jgi:flagellar basal body-associated protein FliL
MGKLGIILGILNTVAIAAVLGLFVYTKLVYKHPAITETQERAKLEQTRQAPSHENARKVTVQLDPITANLDPFTDTDGKQKVHYVSLTLAVEIRDEAEIEKFNAAKPVMLDKVLFHLGKKKFEDLNQVQGRYVFRSQIIDSANEYLGAPIVTEVYFMDFLLQ